jgi:hypothetical protein
MNREQVIEQRQTKAIAPINFKEPEFKLNLGDRVRSPEGMIIYGQRYRYTQDWEIVGRSVSGFYCISRLMSSQEVVAIVSQHIVESWELVSEV